MPGFRNMLFVASHDLEDTRVFERVVELAESHQASLTVIDVQPDPGSHGHGLDPKTVRRALTESSAETLQRYAAAAGKRIELHSRTLFGTVFLEIIRAVIRDGHDAVFKAVGGNNAGTRLLYGSQDMHLLRKCPVPVWLMRTGDDGPCRRILAAVDLDPDQPLPDGDSLNRRILEHAAAQALADAAELHVVHAWQPAFEGILRSRGVFDSEESAREYVDRERRAHRRALDELLVRMGDWLGTETRDYLHPTPQLRQGPAARVIPELARDLAADLVVMGTVGRSGISGFLIGNTAETILQALESSVLAIKPPGFITPVTLTE